MAFSRPGHGLLFRPLHTRSGSPGKRRRSRTPGIEATCAARSAQAVIARDDPTKRGQKPPARAARTESPVVLNLFEKCSPRKGSSFPQSYCCQSLLSQKRAAERGEFFPQRPIGRDACSGGRDAGRAPGLSSIASAARSAAWRGPLFRRSSAAGRETSASRCQSGL